MDRNSFLYIFEISAPRTFGEAWAQGHLKELVPELSKPSKKLDPRYSGEYDFFLDGKIRIEVKASRAVDAESDEPLYTHGNSKPGSTSWLTSACRGRPQAGAPEARLSCVKKRIPENHEP
jgi:hypothetical protein